jgi:WD40 repeat protein
VVVVDTSAGTAVARMSHPDGVSDLALAPDGQRLLTVGRDGTARIWDVDTGGERHVLRGHRGLVTTAVWSADGDTVLTSGVDRTVRAWDPGSGRAGVVLAGLAGYADLALTPDGSQLISVAGDEAQVWAWDVDDLVDIATTRVSRTLTEAECEQYAIERCAAG